MDFAIRTEKPFIEVTLNGDVSDADLSRFVGDFESLNNFIDHGTDKTVTKEDDGKIIVRYDMDGKWVYPDGQIGTLISGMYSAMRIKGWTPASADS